MIVDSTGKPLASDTAKEAGIARAKENFDAMVAVLDERKMPPNELADCIGNLFNLWIRMCPASIYEQQGNLMLGAFLQMLETGLPAKQAEMKIARNLAQNNGAGQPQ